MNTFLLYQIAQEQMRDRQLEAQQARLAASFVKPSTRSRLAHGLQDLAGWLEPELREPKRALR